MQCGMRSLHSGCVCGTERSKPMLSSRLARGGRLAQRGICPLFIDDLHVMQGRNFSLFSTFYFLFLHFYFISPACRTLSRKYSFHLSATSSPRSARRTARISASPYLFTTYRWVISE